MRRILAMRNTLARLFTMLVLLSDVHDCQNQNTTIDEHKGEILGVKWHNIIHSIIKQEQSATIHSIKISLCYILDIYKVKL